MSETDPQGQAEAGPTPNDEPLGYSAKIDDVKARIAEVEAEIELRRRIDESIKNQIEKEKLEDSNEILNLEQAAGMHTSVKEGKAYTTFFKSLKELDREFRRETVSEFKDIEYLKRELRDLRERLRELERKRAFMEAEDG